jgi:general secretion pathway protein D
VVENETANFQVGDQVPITTRTVTPVESGTAPVSNEIEYRDTGIILQVKPRISDNGLVQLEIEQEISAVAGGAALTPVITNRKVSSSISVADGQTVLLGGLISDQTDRGRSGLPGLSRLFGQKSQGKNRIELIIMIRPTVIRDGQDAQHVAEELRGRMWNTERSGGK